ncbi:hypothetical protein HanRHA438_Chr14g0636811 [Helianthus annuus]|nr:hypothetical protein HanRHA438_Chr14g0636811 [Helianthus annuus]
MEQAQMGQMSRKSVVIIKLSVRTLNRFNRWTIITVTICTCKGNYTFDYLKKIKKKKVNKAFVGQPNPTQPVLNITHFYMLHNPLVMTRLDEMIYYGRRNKIKA